MSLYSVSPRLGWPKREVEGKSTIVEVLWSAVGVERREIERERLTEKATEKTVFPGALHIIYIKVYSFE